MNEKYSVSVIIPAYNAEKTIAKSIESVLNQKLKGIEIIVVNDGSTDKTYEVAKRYENSNVEVLNKENGGVSTARNAGIDAADGEYIAFLDSDDYYDTDAITKMYDIAKESKLDIVSCGHAEKNATLYGGNDQTFDDFIATTNKEIGQHYLDLFPKSACMKLFRTAIIKKYKIRFDEGMSLGEDLYFTWSILPYVSRTGGVGSVFYRIENINPISLSKKYVRGIGEDLLIQFQGWKKIVSIFPEAEKAYYCENMDYGLSVIASFSNNLFRIGCPLRGSQKRQEIRRFIKENAMLYKNAKLPERKPKNRFDKIQYKILMTKNVVIISLFYWFKETIKKKKFEQGLKNECIS